MIETLRLNRAWFLVGALLSLATGLALFQSVAPPRGWHARATTILAPHPTSLAYGQPDAGMVLLRPGYALAYDGRTRLARWVGERLTARHLVGDAKRGSAFHVDPDLPAEFRARPSDYEGAGYDRGHLACAANHQHDQAEMDATFYLSNITPQLPLFNRGIWKQLEQDVRDLASEPGTKAIYVFSGPLWLPSEGRVAYDVLGDDLVAVPTHFFKTVLIEPKQGEPRLVAWIIPHDEEEHSLDACRVTVDVVERASGCDFWASLADEDEARLEGQLAAHEASYPGHHPPRVTGPPPHLEPPAAAAFREVFACFGNLRAASSSSPRF